MAQRKFGHGEVVWAKFGEYPWWPAQVNLQTKRQKKGGRVWIDFFDDQGQGAWLGYDNMRPFTKDSVKKYMVDSQHVDYRDVSRAVREATHKLREMDDGDDDDESDDDQESDADSELKKDEPRKDRERDRDKRKADDEHSNDGEYGAPKDKAKGGTDEESPPEAPRKLKRFRDPPAQVPDSLQDRGKRGNDSPTPAIIASLQVVSSPKEAEEEDANVDSVQIPKRSRDAGRRKTENRVHEDVDKEEDTNVDDIQNPTKGRSSGHRKAENRLDEEVDKEEDTNVDDIQIPTKGRSSGHRRTENRVDEDVDMEEDTNVDDIQIPTKGRSSGLRRAENRNDEDVGKEEDTNVDDIQIPMKGRSSGRRRTEDPLDKDLDREEDTHVDEMRIPKKNRSAGHKRTGETLEDDLPMSAKRQDEGTKKAEDRPPPHPKKKLRREEHGTRERSEPSEGRARPPPDVPNDSPRKKSDSNTAETEDDVERKPKRRPTEPRRESVDSDNPADQKRETESAALDSKAPKAEELSAETPRLNAEHKQNSDVKEGGKHFSVTIPAVAQPKKFEVIPESECMLEKRSEAEIAEICERLKTADAEIVEYTTLCDTLRESVESLQQQLESKVDKLAKAEIDKRSALESYSEALQTLTKAGLSVTTLKSTGIGKVIAKIAKKGEGHGSGEAKRLQKMWYALIDKAKQASKQKSGGSQDQGADEDAPAQPRRQDEDKIPLKPGRDRKISRSVRDRDRDDGDDAKRGADAPSRRAEAEPRREKKHDDSSKHDSSRERKSDESSRHESSARKSSKGSSETPTKHKGAPKETLKKVPSAKSLVKKDRPKVSRPTSKPGSDSRDEQVPRELSDVIVKTFTDIFAGKERGKVEEDEKEYKGLDQDAAHDLAKKLNAAMKGLQLSDANYKEKAFQLRFNLKKNAQLRAMVAREKVSMSQLVRMSSDELKTQKLKEEVKKLEARNMHFSHAGTGGAETVAEGLFKCPECKKDKTRYHEMQTRGADEPMTAFISCVNCGYKWKEG